jgi:hypothetical protein
LLPGSTFKLLLETLWAGLCPPLTIAHHIHKQQQAQRPGDDVMPAGAIRGSLTQARGGEYSCMGVVDEALTRLLKASN